MKSIRKIKPLMVTLMTCISALSVAQESDKVAEQLCLNQVSSYAMAVTYNKTSHIIFPSAIRYVDLGSDNLIAGKAADAENVLRVKAAVRDFIEETNFSVITEDGHFYSFDAFYSFYPESLSYDLSKKQLDECHKNSKEVLFRELGTDSPYFTDLLQKGIFKKNERVIRHIGAKGYDIRFLLKGLYVHNGKFYFHTELRNNSNIPFHVEYLSFKIVDKKIARRTVIQEKPLSLLRAFKPLEKIEGSTRERNVLLLDQFTISEDQLLVIEIFEKNGGRHQKLELESSDITGARLIDDIALDIK
jgi:conjugative transposon TraN protein